MGTRQSPLLLRSSCLFPVSCSIGKKEVHKQIIIETKKILGLNYATDNKFGSINTCEWGTLTPSQELLSIRNRFCFKQCDHYSLRKRNTNLQIKKKRLYIQKNAWTIYLNLFLKKLYIKGSLLKNRSSVRLHSPK